MTQLEAAGQGSTGLISKFRIRLVATKSTPDGVGLKLSNYSITGAMNGSIASANNATLATVAANYGGGPALPRHRSKDHAAGGRRQVTAARKPRRLHLGPAPPRRTSAALARTQARWPRFPQWTDWTHR